MNVTVVSGDLAGMETPLLVVPVFEGDAVDPAAAALDQARGGAIAAVRARGDLRGKEGDTLVLYPPTDSGTAERVLLVGVGKADAVTAEKLRRAGGTAAKQAAKLRVSSTTFALPATSVAAADGARAVAEGTVLGA